MNEVAKTDVSALLADWERQGQGIAQALEAERDTIIQRIEQDREYVRGLNEKLASVRLRLGITSREAKPAAPDVRRRIVKMMKAEQAAVPVEYMLPRAPPATECEPPLRPSDFNGPAEVIVAVLKREPGLKYGELVERCVPLRTATKIATWDSTIYALKRKGRVVSEGKRHHKTYRLANGKATP